MAGEGVCLWSLMKLHGEYCQNSRRDLVRPSLARKTICQIIRSNVSCAGLKRFCRGKEYWDTSQALRCTLLTMNVSLDIGFIVLIQRNPRVQEDCWGVTA